MKYKRRIITVFSLLIILTIIIYFYIESKEKNNPYSVKLELSIEYSEYIILQHIWVTVKLINDSKKDYYLKEFFSFDALQLDITAPDKSKWLNGNNGLVPRYMEGDSLKLAPGESKEILYTLITYTPNNYHNKYIPGKHTITALYQGIKSNEVSFELKEQNKEETEFYNILYYSTGPEKIEESIDKYPGSKYIPQAYYRLFSEYNYEYLDSRKGDINRCENDMNKYLSKYANELETTYIIDKYDNYLHKAEHLTDEQVNTKLRDLAANHKCTKADTIINKFIKNKSTR